MTIQNARYLVGRQLGISDYDGSTSQTDDLDPDTQLALTAGLNAYILANSDQFTSAQFATAKAFKGISGQPLADSGFSWTDFADEVGKNATNLIAKPLENIGTSASFIANLIPLIAIIAAIYFVNKTVNK